MTEIKALSLFQGNPQSSDQKPDFWNSSTKQTQKGPGTKKSKKGTMKQVQQLSCTSHETAINNSKKTEWKKKKRYQSYQKNMIRDMIRTSVKI